MECFIAGATKNVTFNSQYIEDYEQYHLNIELLDDIGPLGMENASTLV
jgi:hypothetical protein